MFASLVVVGDRIFVGTANSGMHALNRSDLKDIWQFKPNKAIIDTAYYALNNHSIEATPVVSGKTLWFGADDGYLYGLDIESGNVNEKIEIGFPVVSPVAIVGNWLYTIDLAGRVMAFYDISRK
jgi:outer membrane protein assembly factor BamB